MANSGPTSQDPRPTARLSYDNRQIFYSTAVTKDGAAQLDDGDYTTNPSFGDPIIAPYDVVREYRPVQRRRVDYVILGDSFGSNTVGVKLLYVTLADPTEVEFYSFTGSGFQSNTPQIPLPAYAGALRRIILRFDNKQQVPPSEIEEYGAEDPVEPYQYVAPNLVMASGINGDISDFAENNAANTGYGDVLPAKAAKAKRLGAPRVFIKPSQYYTFDTDTAGNPTSTLTWRINPDHQGFLHFNIQQYLKANGLELYYDFCNAPKEIADTWNSSNLNVNPRPANANPYTPQAWQWYSRAGFNFGQVWATGSAAGTDWATTAEHPTYQNPPDYSAGRDAQVWVTWLNESTLRYAGPQQYTPPKEHVWGLWAFKNGCDGALGPGYGLKTAYPAAKIRLTPPDTADSRWLRAIYAYSGDVRGYQASGRPVIDFEGVTYHLYYSDPLTGEALPLDGWPAGLAQTKEYARTSQEFSPGLPISCTETGYAIGDANGISRGTLPDGSEINTYRVPPVSASHSTPQRAGFWNLRNRHVNLTLGIQTVFYDRGYRPGNYWDAVSPIEGTVQEYYIVQDAAFVAGYTNRGIVQNASLTAGQPVVVLYQKSGQPDKYVAWMPGKSESTGSLTLSVTGSLVKSILQETGDVLLAGSSQAVNGNYTDTVGEAPQYYTVTTSGTTTPPGGGTGTGGTGSGGTPPASATVILQRRPTRGGTGGTGTDPNALSKTSTSQQTVQGPVSFQQTLGLKDASFSDAPAPYQQYSQLANALLALQLGAPQWVAGPQKAGALVYNDGSMWRVKADIANSQTAPTQVTPNAQYYEFVGNPTLLKVLTAFPSNATADNQLITQQSLENFNDYYQNNVIYGRYSGLWGANQSYRRLDMVQYAGRLYARKTAGQEVSTFTPANWSEVLPSAYGLRGSWVANTTYKQYDLIFSQDGTKLLYAKADFTSTATFDTTKWADLPGAGTGGTSYTAGAGIDITGGVLSTKVAQPSGTVLTFAQDAEYAPIYSGTFTVDATGAQVGRVVFAYLGAGASAPTLPAGFERLAGVYLPGYSYMYAFKVASTGKIHYTITPVSV